MTQRRRTQRLSELSVDEISLVDKGANQHAVVTIAKSVGGERNQEMDIFDEQGNQLDVANLDEGDTVYDADGTEYVLEYEDDDEPYADLEQEHDPVPVGKSYSLYEDVQKSLAAAKSDSERDEIVAKALSSVDQLSKEVEIAKRAAADERELRLEREYTEIAKSYNLPIEDEVLGGVLKRCAENLSPEDCEVISKAMTVAGNALFEEYGFIGGGDNVDVMSQLEAEVDGIVSKAQSDISREEMVMKAFDENPDLYDQYLEDKKR